MLTLFYASSLTILALILSFLTGRQRFKTETNLDLEMMIWHVTNNQSSWKFN